jgi:hypothetical protein
MVDTATDGVRFIGLFWVAVFTMQGGIWAYQSLGRSVGILGIGLGVALFIYMSRRPFRLIGGLDNGRI